MEINSIPVDQMYASIDLDANLYHIEREGEEISCIGSHAGNTYLLLRIEQFVTDAMKSDAPGYQVTRDEMGTVKVKELSLAKKYFRLSNSMLDEYSPLFEYSPYVSLFFDCCTRQGLFLEPFGKHPQMLSPVAGEVEAERFNALVVAIREQARSKKTRDQAYARKYNAVRNFREAKQYVDALFSRHSRLLVLRLDFGYRRDYVKQVSVSDAQRHLRRFFNNVRANKLFEHLLGQIWKVECGMEKGIHLHLMLFFDGSRVQKDGHLADQIGRYWKERIVGDCNGVYFNCNRAKNRYKRCGIGMINHDEDAKRENILLALEYLTKKDQFLRYKPKAKCRAFGKGNMPQQRVGRLGRPRGRFQAEVGCASVQPLESHSVLHGDRR